MSEPPDDTDWESSLLSWKLSTSTSSWSSKSYPFEFLFLSIFALNFTRGDVSWAGPLLLFWFRNSSISGFCTAISCKTLLISSLAVSLSCFYRLVCSSISWLWMISLVRSFVTLKRCGCWPLSFCMVSFYCLSAFRSNCSSAVHPEFYLLPRTFSNSGTWGWFAGIRLCEISSVWLRTVFWSFCVYVSMIWSRPTGTDGARVLRLSGLL